MSSSPTEHDLSPPAVGAPSRAAPGTPPLGTVIDNYQLLREVGRGGMGVVFEALHVHLGSTWAVKLLKREWAADPERMKRFDLECRALGRLRNRHIILATNSGLHGGAPYLVMELLKGETLAELLRRGPLVPARALALTRQICQGLAAAHATGTVHRDLKPENLMLVQEEGAEVVKILDFGIAKVTTGISEHLTQTDAVVGTPFYMAPEQVKGSVPVDERTDLYALGVVLYELLSGKRPHRQGMPDLLLAIRDEPPASLALECPGLPAELVALVESALSKDPLARPQSALAFAEALARMQTDPTLPALPAARADGAVTRESAPVTEGPPRVRARAGTVRPGDAGARAGATPREPPAVASNTKRRLGMAGLVAVALSVSALARHASTSGEPPTPREVGSVPAHATVREAPPPVEAKLRAAPPAPSPLGGGTAPARPTSASPRSEATGRPRGRPPVGPPHLVASSVQPVASSAWATGTADFTPKSAPSATSLQLPLSRNPY
jgi:serine/threonine-protein kinase